ALLALGGISDPAPVRRPCGRRVVTAIRGQLVRTILAHPDFPDRAGHRESQLLAVGRPCGTPRSAGRWWHVVAVHIPGGVTPTGCMGGRREQQQEPYESEMVH